MGLHDGRHPTPILAHDHVAVLELHGARELGGADEVAEEDRDLTAAVTPHPVTTAVRRGAPHVHSPGSEASMRHFGASVPAVPA
jgi:hypothetical protein